MDPVQKSIKQYLHDHQDEMVEMTRRLCSFATENPPGNHFEECVDYLEGVMRARGFATQKVRVPDAYQKKYLPPECQDKPRFNLISRWDTGASRTLHFNSHYDVVPATEGWKTDPFSPVIQGRRLFGRGTSDMKGCLVASLYAVQALKALKLRPAWNLELSFTADEEIGGECGAGFIVKEKIVRPDAAVVCEGGEGNTIMFGHRGVLWADILVRGVPAHGSNPGAGVNAFERGVCLAHRFLEYHQRCLERVTRHEMDKPHACRPSMTLGGVSGGGSKVNTIPGWFHFTVDRRLLPEERVAAVIREFQGLLREAKREDSTLKAEMRILTGFDAAITDSTSPLCEAACQAVGAITGKTPQPRIFGAFTDLHFFTNQARCPAIGYGVEGAGIHGHQEYLVIPSLVSTARVYAEIARMLR
ncbi:MAG: M20 family metallopeptidase [bacterium]